MFDRIFAALAGEGPKPERIMIDATHLNAHRTAASLFSNRSRATALVWVVSIAFG